MANRDVPPTSNGEPRETMKAVFWEGKPYEVAVHDTPKAKIVDATDVVVRVSSAAICGTDLHTYHGVFGSAKVPYPLGHEAMGYVTAIGADVKAVKVGDRVIIPDLPASGVFPTNPSLNENITTFGFGPDFGNLGGCQAEYVRVPFGDESVEVIPPGIPDKEYLFISDIWATSWTALDFAGFQAGDTVAIFGAGPVGLLCAYSALLRGAARVYSIDHVAARLAVAKSIGAIPINLTQDGGPAAQIIRLEPGGVTRACDCIGEEAVNTERKYQEGFVIQEAVKMVSVMGGIGVIGVYFKQPTSAGVPNASRVHSEIPFPISQFWSKNLSLQAGAVDAKQLAPKLIELVKSGRARPGFIVSLEIDIEEAPRGYRRFNDYLETKVVLRFPEQK